LACLQIDSLCRLGAVLATTSMNFSVTQLTAPGARNPVSGLRFLHPVLLMDIVEMSQSTEGTAGTGGRGETASGFEIAKKCMNHLGISEFVYIPPGPPPGPDQGQPHDGIERLLGQPAARRRLTEDEVRECRQRQKDLVASGKPGAVPSLSQGEGTLEGHVSSRDGSFLGDGASGASGAPSGGALPSYRPEEITTCTCAVCLENQADALILPCGHTECCIECVEACIARGDSRCPTCRACIENHLPQATRRRSQQPQGQQPAEAVND
jgi:hypothetical protein